MNAETVWVIMRIKEFLEIAYYIFGTISGIAVAYLFYRQFLLEKKQAGYQKRTSLAIRIRSVLVKILISEKIGDQEKEFMECHEESRYWFAHDKKIQSLLDTTYKKICTLIERDKMSESEDGKKAEMIRRNVKEQLGAILLELERRFQKYF
jgi:hypothetical protein